MEIGHSQLKSDTACEYCVTRDSSAVVRAAVLSVANGSMNPLKRVTLSHIWNNVPSGEVQWVSIMNVIGNCIPGVAYETGFDGGDHRPVSNRWDAPL